MTAIPSTIALTQPADESPATASDQRSDHSAIQTAVNGLIGWAQTAGFALTYRKVTAKAVNTTTAATDLLNGEVTIAAGAMGTTGVARLTAWGDWLQNSGGNAAPPRLQVVLGSTTLLDTGVSGNIGATATRFGWRVAVEILNLGATGSQLSSILATVASNNIGSANVNGVFTTGEGQYYGINAALGGTGVPLLATGVNPATSVDTTVANVLALKVINGSANAAYETKLLGALVEIV